VGKNKGKLYHIIAEAAELFLCGLFRLSPSRVDGGRKESFLRTDEVTPDMRLDSLAARFTETPGICRLCDFFTCVARSVLAGRANAPGDRDLGLLTTVCSGISISLADVLTFKELFLLGERTSWPATFFFRKAGDIGESRFGNSVGGG